MWLAESAAGELVVKLLGNPHVAAGEPWRTRMLAALASRGYPLPDRLWHGWIGGEWYAVVERRLPGKPLATLDSETLDRLLRLVDLQAGADADLAGGFDVARWIRLVLFEGWEGWAERARRGSHAGAEVCERVDRLVAPVRGVELEPADLVHHDLNLSNVLIEDGRISSVVDWDGGGLGPRALDLACLLFEWERLRLSRVPGLPPDGADRILGQFREAGGDAALRLTVAYRTVAVLGVTAARGEQDRFDRWTRAAAAVLTRLGV